MRNVERKRVRCRSPTRRTGRWKSIRHSVFALRRDLVAVVPIVKEFYNSNQYWINCIDRFGRLRAEDIIWAEEAGIVCEYMWPFQISDNRDGSPLSWALISNKDRGCNLECKYTNSLIDICNRCCNTLFVFSIILIRYSSSFL